MKKILWLTNTEKRREYLQRGFESLQRAENITTQCDIVLVDLGKLELLDEAYLTSYEIVLVSFMSAQEGSDALYQRICSIDNLPYVLLASTVTNFPLSRHVDSELIMWVEKGLLYSGLFNTEQIWRRLIAVFGQDELSWEEPRQTIGNGLYHPNVKTAYASYEAYALAHCKPDRLNIGILFLRDDWLWGNTEVYDALIAEIERQGMNAIPLFSYWVKNEEENIEGVDEAVQKFFGNGSDVHIDVLINNFKMSMLIGRPVEKDFLTKLGVPVLQAYHTRASYEEWQHSTAGLRAQEVSATVSMVEYDGVIHGVPISNQSKRGSFVYRQPIPERIEMLVNKAKKWAMLRYKDNKDKKVAIIFHNYPTNNAFLGCAADLDSGESVWRLLNQLKEAGYSVSDIPASSKELMQYILQGLTNDTRYVADEQISDWKYRFSTRLYEPYFTSLPNLVQQEMVRMWGESPGNAFLHGEDFLIAGREFGNVFVSMQPPRGFGEDSMTMIHSPIVPPTHHYVAYYQWLREVWLADVVIHVGTHGSLEWLPGKQNGLSHSCYPEIALGDLPNIYPYLVTISGEGVQAKRRGAACLIGYLPAPAQKTPLYKEWQSLETLTEEYSQFLLYNKDNVELVWEDILQQLERLGDEQLITAAHELSREEFFLKLHNQLEELKTMQVKNGLHILGEMPQGNALREFLYQLCETSQQEIEGLPYFVADLIGIDYTAFIKKATKSLDEIEKWRLIEARVAQFLEVLEHYDYQNAAAVLELDWLQEQRERAMTIARYITGELVPRIQGGTKEMTNILHALRGAYVEPAPSGSPASGNADVLPTGRNFYGIDPTLLPTPAAWKLGVELSDEVIRQYIADEGKYPEQVGIIIWCGPNMRSRGQCIAQILHLLGVRPLWQSGTYKVIGLEVIPLEELKRPRIDVVARISGLVRDALPNVVMLINKAVQLIDELDESHEDNYVKKHSDDMKKSLEGKGRSSEEALIEARYRVFGCPPRAYGAGVGALLESKAWDDDKDLAQTYIEWGGYAYDAQGQAIPAADSFVEQLRRTDIAIKNEDTKDLHMLSSDDFNAYHGGMIAAVRAIRGKAPKGYKGDSSDRHAVKVRTVEDSFRRVFYGEVLNPVFIEGMMKHGHKGALEMAKYATLSYGWDATSRVMNNGMYNQLADSYVLDERVHQWMKEVNPWAARQIVEVLLEANQRQLWQADEDMLLQLREKYLQIEGCLEE